MFDNGQPNDFAKPGFFALGRCKSRQSPACPVASRACDTAGMLGIGVGAEQGAGTTGDQRDRMTPVRRRAHFFWSSERRGLTKVRGRNETRWGGGVTRPSGLRADQTEGPRQRGPDRADQTADQTGSVGRIGESLLVLSGQPAFVFVLSAQYKNMASL